jgi:hypothetical protein
MNKGTYGILQSRETHVSGHDVEYGYIGEALYNMSHRVKF